MNTAADYLRKQATYLHAQIEDLEQSIEELEESLRNRRARLLEDKAIEAAYREAADRLEADVSAPAIA